MVRLSIVIPALRDVSALESTLVSVLSNRPADCEVLVVLSSPYDDPYQLSDEVHFVDAPRGAGWTRAVNVGLAASQASIVHVLYPGVQVSEGWAQLAVRHFNNPTVAAVSPVVLNAQQSDRVLATGVNYNRRGERLLTGAGISVCAAAGLADALGPTAWAGFYRRSAVLDLLGGFDPAVGDRHSDVDLALRLQQAGYRAVTEARSHVTCAPVRAKMSISDTYFAERLFWRNQARQPRPTSIAAHVGLMCQELVAKLPLSPLHLGARMAAGLQVAGHVRHCFTFRAMKRQVSISLALAESSTRHYRVDEAQATLSMSRKPTRKPSPQRRAA